MYGLFLRGFTEKHTFKSRKHTCLLSRNSTCMQILKKEKKIAW